MADVFISYSNLDASVAQDIGNGLQRMGIDVFTDDTVLVAGKQAYEQIEKALRESDVAVILLSTNSRRSSWVEEEISRAINRKKNVIALLLDENAENNWVWPLIANREAIDMRTESIEAAIRKIACAIEPTHTSLALSRSAQPASRIATRAPRPIRAAPTLSVPSAGQPAAAGLNINEANKLPEARFFGTNIPARLDRLPWSRFHTRVCVVLGLTWILFGLGVTLVSPLDPVIRPAVWLSRDPMGTAVLFYLLGSALGALIFAWATDRFGRSKLMTITILIFLLGTAATGCAWSDWSFVAFRLVTGAGIGGAYVAVNSTLQELIPAHYRGTTIISVNGFFWAGAMFSALASLVVLDPHLPYPEIGWRAAFLVAGTLALITVPLLRWIPESPRWLIAHGRPGGADEAERIVASIEAEVGREHNVRLLPERVVQLFQLDHTTIGGAARLMFRTYKNMFGRYRNRTVLGLALMASQAFLYNGIIFDYGRQLTELYGVQIHEIGRYMLPLAFSNFVGALVLGRLFDSVGRTPMIIITYALSGILLAFTGLLFWLGMVDAWGHTACWMTIFFVASAAASSAYLTVGEAFPLEMRATSIALLFAFGTAIGGVFVPLLFGWLIPAGALNTVYYFLAAALMMVAAGTAWYLGFPAERRSIEEAAAAAA